MSIRGVVTKFWCHQCRAQIQPTSDFACMRCGSEFIEEMESSGAEDDPTTFVAFDQLQAAPPSDQPSARFPFNHPALFAAPPQHNTTQQTQVLQQPPLPSFNPPLNDSQTIALDFGQLVQQVDGILQQLAAVQPGQPYQQQQQQHRGDHHPAAPFFGPPTTVQLFTTNGGAAAGALPPVMNFQSFMQNTLSALYGGEMVGNPGDYAFGSLDNIITRLMEAAGDRGPPPAAREVIDSLPSERISQEAVDAHEDCPICKDEYKAGEEALRLFCKHRFHPTCIREWLGRRNTCPVCRSELVQAATATGEDDTTRGGRSGGGRQHNENDASADSPSQFYL